MPELIEDVPMSFYGLDEALQLLKNRTLEREPAPSWPESMPPFPESRGVVATFAARAWLALIRRLQVHESCDCFGRV